MKVSTYKELIVWQKAIDLIVLIYKYSAGFPKEELYGLIMQMRRCAVSIPSNIAEGWSRKGLKEYANFLSISQGSASELETQLIVSGKLNFGVKEHREVCLALLDEIQRMLGAMARNLPTGSR